MRLENEPCHYRYCSRITRIVLVKAAEVRVPSQKETASIVQLIRVDVIQQVPCPLRVIEDVESLPANLEAFTLADAEFLHELEIDIIGAPQRKCIAAGVGIGTQSCLNVLGVGISSDVSNDQRGVRRRS